MNRFTNKGLSFPLTLFPCLYLRVVHSLPQSHGIDADIDVTTLVHQLKVGGTLDPRGGTGERQV